MKWDDIPVAGKMTVSAVVTLAAAVTWMFATFETASGSEEKWEQHNQAIACRTVYELKAEIRVYLRDMKNNPNLTQQNIDAIKEEITALQEDIKRIDPNGACP